MQGKEEASASAEAGLHQPGLGSLNGAGLLKSSAYVLRNKVLFLISQNMAEQ